MLICFSRGVVIIAGPLLFQWAEYAYDVEVDAIWRGVRLRWRDRRFALITELYTSEYLEFYNYSHDTHR